MGQRVRSFKARNSACRGHRMGMGLFGGTSFSFQRRSRLRGSLEAGGPRTSRSSIQGDSYESDSLDTSSGGQTFSRGLNSIVSGTSDWKTLQTPFMLKAGQKAKKFTLNVVINGKGTVWIDDARLLKQPLK